MPSHPHLKQVVCVKWGTLFGPEYVNRMYGMVKRNITTPFKLVCLTDDPAGIREEVECHELPELGVPHPERTIGKWRKQILWARTLPGLTGTALFIDLDSVIVDNIDDYFSIGEASDVYVARNWARPLEKLGQTSVFRFPVGGNPHLLDDFRNSPQKIADEYGFEQHYVTARVTGGVKFWPETWTKHFRLHCLPPFPLRYFMQAKIPKGAKIITFPGGPNPDDIQECRWNKNAPAFRSRLDHIKAVRDEKTRVDKNPRRHLMRYVLPTDWIAQHWKD
ncbi:MAG: hypothetical protein RIQ53_1524 [Pseudomonadota bacterium]|jgi:hypothetical protein